MGKEEENGGAYAFVDSGPPPDIRQRELIFDSFSKIVGRQEGRQKGRGARRGANRGAFCFTWGAGYHGQLGRKFIRGERKFSSVPVMVETDAVVRQVTCGGLHSAMVTEHGDVFTWGEGNQGQLGYIDEAAVGKSIPRQVEGLDSMHIVQVACGASHTVALTDTGTVYSWGYARFGQLGHGDRQTVKTPKRIDSSLAKEIVQIACGNKHTLAINKHGIALSWGSGEHGQTGQSETDKLVPTIVDELERLQKLVNFVACGSIHSCFITTTGELFQCGFGEFFYANETQHFFYKPKFIAMPEPLQQIACGQSHNVALSTTGNVYTWGSGEYGQLGYGIKGNASSVPRLILDEKNIAQVHAGRYHSVALSSAGQLYSWGCGENGQLGLNSDENVALPTVVTHILGAVVGQVACGGHHTAVLTSAPWSKLSHDTSDWLAASKKEEDLKRAILKKTQRGLRAQDLAKVKQEMKKWLVQHLKRKEESKLEEEMELDRGIASIQFRDALQESVLKDMEEKSSKTLKLPAVQDERAEPREEHARTTGEKEAVRLPKVQKKKAQTTKAPTAHRSTESPYGRAISPKAGQEQPGSHEAPAVVRTAFLKETAQMVERMKSVVSEKGDEANQKELARMARLVFTFRKEYDTLRHTGAILTKEAESLKREQELLESSSQLANDTYSKCYERLKALEMQLNTVTIKIAETSENRRNYELNIAHLKEEDFENFNQLRALRKQNQDNNSFFKKMNQLKEQAVEEKEKAEAELEEFRLEIKEYQTFVTEQLKQFESVLDLVRTQNDKRDKSKDARSEATRSKMAARIDKLQKEAEATDKETGGLTARLTSLDLKLRHFEDSFQKITSATGLANPDAIVNKFFFKGEIKEQLELEIEDRQAYIEQLKTEEEDLQKKLAESKDAFTMETWADVEHLGENHREVSVQAQRNAGELSATTSKLASAQEGLLSLLATVEDTLEKPQTSLQGSEDLWTEALSTEIVDTLCGSVDLLLEIEKEKKRKQEEEELKRAQEQADSQKRAEEEGDGVFNAFKMDARSLKELKGVQDDAPAGELAG